MTCKTCDFWRDQADSERSRAEAAETLCGDRLQQLYADRKSARELAADAARLDYLDTLMARTEYQNSRRPAEPVKSDMHFDAGRCSLYVRNLFADCVVSVSGQSVREAIDAAMEGQP